MPSIFKKVAISALALLLIASNVPLASAGVVVKSSNTSSTIPSIVATGGTITTVTQGGIIYRVHTFTTVGSADPFVVTSGSGKVWYLVVAGGGGGGGGGNSGAGGAGGYLSNAAYSYAVSPGNYTVTVGDGGAAGSGPGPGNDGSNGNNSVFDTITATGGGGGANGDTAAPGHAGGSGGGASRGNNSGGAASPAGQGNSGGAGFAGGVYGGGGGGGAGAAGAPGTTSTGGNGGDGIASSISGASVTYAGGGGGGSYFGPVGNGGAGGGGAGGNWSVGPASVAGTANTGGGGGGAGISSTGAKGGSGIVIIRYPIGMTSTTLSATGGTITTVTSGGILYRVHTFTATSTSQTFQVTGGSGKVWYLVVAGGGGGGDAGGGGGAGGFRTNGAYNYPVSTGSYAVTVGDGGAGSTLLANAGVNGSNSVFDTITSTGGGAGNGGSNSPYNGVAGGSGGGGWYTGSGGVASPSGQGNSGGNGAPNGGYGVGGGGGGSGSVGVNATVTTGGNGGNGTSSSISGASVTYAGGGGGGINSAAGSTFGTGQAGGGNGTASNSTAGSGTANSGSGGGGGGYTSGNGGNGGKGGSGIVIIRYAIGAATTRSTLSLDPYWNNVVLLVANDNKAGSTTVFADQSKAKHVMTTNGNAQYDTAQAPTGMTSAMLLDGTGDYLSSADSGDWNLGAGDFTLEGMIRYADKTNYGTLISQYATITSDASFWVVTPKTADSNGYFEWTTNGSTNNFQAFAWTPSINTWYHIAVVRSGNVVRYFVNGTQIGSDLAFNNTIYNSTTLLKIGSAANATTWDLNGWLSNVRITKGVARYTSNFTPPRLPFPTGAITTSNTSVSPTGLTSGLTGWWTFDGKNINWRTNTTADSSGQGNTGSLINMSTSTSPVAGKIGQALNFDGSSGYVNIPYSSVFDLGTGNFAVSVWLNARLPATDRSIIEWGTYNANGFLVRTNEVGAPTISIYIGGVGYAWSNTFTANKWYHLAIVRNNATTMQAYVNGVSLGTVTIPSGATITAGGGVTKIGQLTSGANNGPWAGMLDDVRLYNRALSPAEVKLLYNSGR